jgi:hypothetical protein
MSSIGEQPLGQVVTGPILAQEIVRSVAGTLGLIAAVPITTALAAFTCARRTHPATENDHGPAYPGDGHGPVHPGDGHGSAHPGDGYAPVHPAAEPEMPPPGWPRSSADPFA